MSAPTTRIAWRRVFAAAALLSLVLQAVLPFGFAPAFAASVSSAAFSGGTGTASVNGTLYAKNGAALTLTVTTDSNTQCVRVTDGTTSIDKDASSARTTWTFTSADSATLFTAGSGDGVKSVTATAYKNSNGQHHCTANQGEQFGTKTASYVLDNTGPVVTGSVAPAANAAGWNKSDVTITWSATDAGSGVVGSPNPGTDSVTADTAGVTKTATATDRLGNSGNGSVTVKLDKSAPTITGNRSPAANANGWNNTDVTASFACSDSPSGIKSCTGSSTLSNSAANQSVTGTAVDNADNSASATVSDINIDKVAPTLSGAPTSSPNADGWYDGDVTVHWTAGDGLSGVLVAPADSTITGEGNNLTASASVSDKAGNTTTATSSPAVNIDRTPPVTAATAPSNWNNVDVTVTLDPKDALSGVAATYYKLDGAGQQSGTSVTIGSDGVHILEFWSVDKAGNVEGTKTVQVKIDKTPPTINHTQDPAANGNGWNNGDVTVTFTCDDPNGSGVASCTGPQTVATEGKDEAVTGTATDNAGNTTTDPATVSIDKTAPTISASADRGPNANGWYNDDVTVTFACEDKLSGIDTCPAPKKLGEGANQAASGTAVDAAGNSANAGVNGINVDKTAPDLSGAATAQPNANGWYNGDVTIKWSTSDGLSGLDGNAPADSTITGEGNNLSASASVSDKAGNTASATVRDIKIDRTAPSTLVSVPDPLASGWYAGDVQVTLTTGPDLSGVDKTYYAVDGGAAQIYGGPFNDTLKGSHTITFWSVDKAGNVEDVNVPGHSITLKIDGVPPTITGSRTPDPNGFGWNNGSVTVSFNCSDQESGIASCTGGTTLNTEAQGKSVQGQATDNAGNTASATVSEINIDLTAPTLTGAATTSPNANGWYKGDVTIHWTGQDALSGIDPATQPADSTITGEGSNLGAGPVTIYDKAGNVSAAALVSGINIDRNPPAVTLSGGPADGATYYFGSVPAAPACSATDALSGVDGSCTVSGYSTALGNQTVTATATDKAGNTATSTVHYTVAAWTMLGFYQPVDMSTSTGIVYNTVKNGSTVPIKFELFAGATELTDVAQVKALTYAQTNCDATATTDDIETLATGNTSLRYDTTAGQFVYNWKTPSTAGKCYRVTVTAQDGSAQSAYFKLR